MKDEVEKLVDELYNPEITDLELNEYQDKWRPVVYKDQVPALIQKAQVEAVRAARQEQIMQDFLTLIVDIDVDESILIDWRERQLANLKDGETK